jgi:hypothetical protein
MGLQSHAGSAAPVTDPEIMAGTFELAKDRGVLRVGSMELRSRHRIKLMSGAFPEYRYLKALVAFGKSMHKSSQILSRRRYVTDS